MLLLDFKLGRKDIVSSFLWILIDISTYHNYFDKMLSEINLIDQISERLLLIIIKNIELVKLRLRVS